MPDDKRKILYDAVSKDYDIGTFDDFNGKMEDGDKRKAFYDGVGAEYSLGTFDEFNNKIGALARGFDKRSIPTLIFVNEIEHGNRIQALIPGSRFISGKELRVKNKKDLADFNNRKFNILIGTSVIGEGVDTVPAQVGILASGFKAESEVIQKIGRLLRPSPGKGHSTFIDFMNIGCKYLSRHCKKRIQIYKSYGDDITHKLL